MICYYIRLKIICAVTKEITPCISFIKSILDLDASFGRYSSPCIKTESPEKPKANAVREKFKAGDKTLEFEIKTEAFPISKKEVIKSISSSFFTNDTNITLIIEKKDYRKLFYEWCICDKVCFLVDPPYLSTESGTYTGYWRLHNYLDVLQTVKGTNYFYFTSNKSSIIELCDWLEKNYGAYNPFHGATRVDIVSRMNYNSVYTDIMLYKRKDHE